MCRRRAISDLLRPERRSWRAEDSGRRGCAVSGQGPVSCADGRTLSTSSSTSGRQSPGLAALLITSETSIAQLHEILQQAFDWSGEHLHRFRIHGRDYGSSLCGGITFDEDARQVTLSGFCLHDGERFRYEYDFTAGWALDVRLEQVLPWAGGPRSMTDGTLDRSVGS